MKKARNNMQNALTVILITLLFGSCGTSSRIQSVRQQEIPAVYDVAGDTVNSAVASWRSFFGDEHLALLIDSALVHNQELNVMMQEINIAKNEVRARKGEYLPFVGVGAAGGVEKVGRYTSQGANDANTEIMPGREFPEPLPDVALGANVSWEIDIWKKLRNAKKSAAMRYLATVEGRNFMVTNLVAEIASSYYELLALHRQLEILQQNIGIQADALGIMRMEKNAAKVTELAVRKFEAEVFRNRSLTYAIRQKITETENRINFLAGRFPQPVERDSADFLSLAADTVLAGKPSQLLFNRPDIRMAEKELAAARLDVSVARASFYPSLRLTAGAGLRAFDPNLLLKLPESLIFSLAGDLVAPLINRNAIKAAYSSATSRQVQKVYEYQRAVLHSYIEVANQLSMIRNLRSGLELKMGQVESLNKCVGISGVLFKSARADYMEVLMTQRDALDARFELVETKMQQLKARIGLYRALGGGWR